MRIVQINSVCDFGSTGRTTRELADYLNTHGHECFIAYGQGVSSYKNSMKIGGKWENHFHNLIFTRILGLHGFGTKNGTKKLIQWLDKVSPDIIHLRNIHANYLNYPILFEYIINKQIPVVFTLHDCFNFTGKCAHYTAIGCKKWQSQCYKCPTYKHCVAPSLIFDNSKKIFNQKLQYYQNFKSLNIVAVSNWLRNEAMKSPLLASSQRIECIYNWIDHLKFHRAAESELSNFFEKYNLSKDFKYLISVSQGWDKNSSRYNDALKLAHILPSEYKLILVGSTLRGTTIESPLIHIPFIQGVEELCKAYTMAEAYVHLSVEDTFGKVIAEAMACGTVPITFNSTACGETPGPYGIIVAPHDVNSIVQSLPKISELKKKRAEIIGYVRQNYDYNTNAQRYLNLYNEILNQNN